MKFKSDLKNIILIFSALILTIFVIGNIYASQSIPVIYEKFANGNQSGLIEFMQKAKNLSMFQQILPEIRDNFQKNKEAVYADETKRKAQIGKLENILTQNPDAPQVIYLLSKLYEQDGQKLLAQKYLERARALDPSIGK